MADLAPLPRNITAHASAKRPRWMLVSPILAAAVVVIIAVVFIHWWPFTQAQVLQTLQQAGDSQVQLRSFRATYFPAPGCILEGVVFHHSDSTTKPLIVIEKLTIRGSYLGLLSRSVNRIDAEGMRISIPPFGSGAPFHATPSKISIGQIFANGTVLEFASSDPRNSPLRFEIHEAFLRNVEWTTPLSYQVKVHNPQPPGEVTVEGKFGVWVLGNAGETPLSGSYKLEQADLSVYGGIAGTLASTGKFEGKLAHIDISGETDTPDFNVSSGNRPMRLATKFSAYVNATRGDTYLKQVDADFSKTHVIARGSIAGSPNGGGKTAVIDLSARRARIEDFLILFIKEGRSPMSGPVTFQAHVQIPPGDDFLRKVKLRGNFGIGQGAFADSSTQEGMDKLSAGARGEAEKEKEDPETVLADLKGSVDLTAGTAHFAELTFGIPGVHSRMHGTYNLMNHKIDLRGQMRVDTKISNTTSGTKALLLKMMDPFFRKKRVGEVVPVRISGSYEHPTFGLDLDDKNAHNKKLPNLR
jgi:hypothetical protein